jgi:hypothetical protein
MTSAISGVSDLTLPELGPGYHSFVIAIAVDFLLDYLSAEVVDTTYSRRFA